VSRFDKIEAVHVRATSSALAPSPDLEKTEAASLRRSIGVVIRSLRERKRLTQNELAVASGLTRVSIGRIERGDMNASIDSMLMICTALSTSLLHVLTIAEAHATLPRFVLEADDAFEKDGS